MSIASSTRLISPLVRYSTCGDGRLGSLISEGSKQAMLSVLRQNFSRLFRNMITLYCLATDSCLSTMAWRSSSTASRLISVTSFLPKVGRIQDSKQSRYLASVDGATCRSDWQKLKNGPKASEIFMLVWRLRIKCSGSIPKLRNRTSGEKLAASPDWPGNCG